MPFTSIIPKLVRTLEIIARERGIEFIDAKVARRERGPQGIAAIVLEDNRRLEADFFIDASGFRSELLGKTLEEPYISFSSSLFNDRAMVGSWPREPDEPILPYTTAETMDCGWCWRIDHEHEINRGYVYSSIAISTMRPAKSYSARIRKSRSATRSSNSAPAATSGLGRQRHGDRQRMRLCRTAGIQRTHGHLRAMRNLQSNSFTFSGPRPDSKTL